MEQSERDVACMSQEAIDGICTLTAEAKTEEARLHGEYLQELTKMLITRLN